MTADEKTRKVIYKIAEKIKNKYKPDRLILFGSFAYGTPNRDGDIDLLIIKDVKERLIDRRVTVTRIAYDSKRLTPLESTALTPRELDERPRVGDQFIQEMLQKGEVLYDS